MRLKLIEDKYKDLITGLSYTRFYIRHEVWKYKGAGCKQRLQESI